MKLKFLTICLLACLFMFCTNKSEQKTENSSITEHPGNLSKEDMQWFTDAKFGMFIHWGPYSVFEGEWDGRQVPVGENAEWIMQKLQIPVKEYRKVAKTFNPAQFNAGEWTDLAQKAGMKYLVITSKHHDGFAMYDSKVSDYNIVDYTPYGKDPMQDLSAACKEKDIRFCFYYSHREDWDDPYAYGNFWDFETSQQKGYEYEIEKADYFESYLEKKAKPQLKELLTNYGPIGLVWFDRGMYTPEQGYEFIKIIRDLQPKCLVNGRVGNYNLELIGDYQNLSDNGMPASGVDEFWETPQTLNETWGFSRFDTRWKSPTEIIHRLAEVVSKGGNYLLNIGPKGDGTIPQASIDVLEEVGNWMEKNNESIYGTSASPLAFHDWGFCTAKESVLYLHILNWPENGKLEIRNLRNKILSAKTLDGGASLMVNKAEGKHQISLQDIVPNQHNTVIKLQLEGLPEVDPEIIQVQKDESILLDNMTVHTSGKTKKRYNRRGKLFISKWNSPEDRASWLLGIIQPGEYQLKITYSSPEESVGSQFQIKIGENTVTSKVENTGVDFDYKSFDLGEVSFDKAGTVEVTVNPERNMESDLMYFKSLELVPIL
ncbi:alpha-L-fucosidase [Draconibacterium sp.]|nr:alpha-L-fucosidase [Draconibacterium sp.]